jgi:peptide deformylase
MAERKIVPFGDPILRKIAKPVEQLSPRILSLLDDMVDTLYAADGRAGLAAPQVGVLRRIVVMDCGDGLIELINPEILHREGKQIGPEACLSFPGYTGIVERAKYVKVRSMDRKGSLFELEAEDELAVCIQHEVDHLNGILFIDHIQGNQLFHESTRQRVNLLDVIKLSRPTE